MIGCFLSQSSSSRLIYIFTLFRIRPHFAKLYMSHYVVNKEDRLGSFGFVCWQFSQTNSVELFVLVLPRLGFKCSHIGLRKALSLFSACIAFLPSFYRFWFIVCTPTPLCHFVITLGQLDNFWIGDLISPHLVYFTTSLTNYLRKVSVYVPLDGENNQIYRRFFKKMFIVSDLLFNYI